MKKRNFSFTIWNKVNALQLIWCKIIIIYRKNFGKLLEKINRSEPKWGLILFQVQVFGLRPCRTCSAKRTASHCAFGAACYYRFSRIAQSASSEAGHSGCLYVLPAKPNKTTKQKLEHVLTQRKAYHSAEVTVNQHFICAWSISLHINMCLYIQGYPEFAYYIPVRLVCTDQW